MPVVRDPEDKKERILTSALRLFTEKGFEGTPIPDLAKDAGIGAGTIYRYYKNKEELVNELYRFWKNKLRETLAENYPEKAKSKDLFVHLWKALATFYHRYPEAFEFLELHYHSPYLDQASKKATSQTMEFICTFLEQAKAKGDIRSDLGSMELVSLCYGSFVGMVKMAKGGYIQLSAETLHASGLTLWKALAK
ncbi:MULTISPECIES: TetR/AcrR family transcriptional regulator [Leptospira]|uniref:TetR/AcrR family transcriptional regulator n=2 Tax=Leptospira TaxID=171 RepID=A0A4R9GCS4_9LEPT|nr:MULTISPECIES: TetR/AcrR family transcriptional regulator [Leptospira]PKA17953.1 TetR family transcriptional regulator [Leptospira haakeii]PKA21678.1 TetR family transcriptional regulator [Leptospira haakeii]TGK09533.1 TetR/AcrR family transcriptional regulator [Leptospira selangorensis]TGM16263.1 TetR/AcrR family transcriptional regulator [Leptospira selangorensis]TGM17786.1 TetR/AcrR family transcriptional regulator [Leptospira selangorensis]